MSKIDLHMLRERADKLDEISEEKFSVVNKENRELMQE